MRYATSLLLSAGLSVMLAGTAGAADKIRIGLVLPDLSNQAIADIDTGARARR